MASQAIKLEGLPWEDNKFFSDNDSQLDYWNEKFNSARRGKVITKEMEADAAAEEQKKFDAVHPTF